MMRRALLALCLAFPAGSAAQEGLYPALAATGGAEARGYSFGQGFVSGSVRQVSFPVGVVVPIGRRLSLDIGSAYVTTRRTGLNDEVETITDFTDTQVRAAYVFGRDLVVASLLLNLPTGPKTDATQVQVTSAVSSNFLPFPVNSYANGTSVTAGLAAATQAGAWNLGAASSVRLSADYRPFANSTFEYQPGVEGRFRLGADRLVGSSRLMLGATFSTFGDDTFTGTGAGTGAGRYEPGNRFIGEASVLTPVGDGSLMVYAWDYYRGAGAGTANAENVFTAGVSGTIPLSPLVSLTPLAEARVWSPEQGSGRLFGTGGTLQVTVTQRVGLSAGARLDIGSLTTAAGQTFDITGWGGTVLVRVQW